jgi:hypothetical protein
MSDLTEFLLARVAPECGCSTHGKIVRGMCATHYDRWVHATPKDQRAPAPRTVRDFWAHVDKSGDCWTWTGPTNRQGYGTWSSRHHRGLAHRVALLEAVGAPSEDGMFACHKCDNPPCVNPGHLYWGTAADNARDYAARQGVHNKGVFATHCPKGHEIAGDNLRIAGGRRFCRACDNARSRERQRRLREARRAAR